MGVEICEACGHPVNAHRIVRFPLVPDDVETLHELLDSRLVKLCQPCHGDLQAWYQKQVSTTIFDEKLNQFRARTPDEITQGYESVLHSFIYLKRHH